MTQHRWIGTLGVLNHRTADDHALALGVKNVDDLRLYLRLRYSMFYNAKMPRLPHDALPLPLAATVNGAYSEVGLIDTIAIDHVNRIMGSGTIDIPDPQATWAMPLLNGQAQPVNVLLAPGGSTEQLDTRRIRVRPPRSGHKMVTVHTEWSMSGACLVEESDFPFRARIKLCDAPGA